MPFIHQELARGGWFKLNLFEQMANIGSEVERAILWRKKRDKFQSQRAFERALELFDLTLADKRLKNRLKEVARAREIVGDYFTGKNEYHTTDNSLQKYFYPFFYATRKDK